MRRALLSGVAVACLIAGVGCDGSEPDPPQAPDRSPVASPSTTEPSSPPDSQAHRCPNEGDIVESDEVIGGAVRGDIDSDGEPDDRAFLVSDGEGVLGCRNFLVAEFHGERLVTPTTEEGVQYALEVPRIHAIVQIDGDGSAEILVDLEQGASSQFLGMFTIVEGDLERVVVQENTDFGNLFPYGGSVGHFEASNCVDHPRADVAVSVAIANTTDYTIRTRLYDLRGAALFPLPRPQQPAITVGDDLDRAEGFATSPFGEC